MNNNKNTEKNPINTKHIMSMAELKEEFFKSLAVCESCVNKRICPDYSRAAVIGLFLESEDEGEEEDPLLKSVYEDDEEEESCEDTDDEAKYEIPAIPPHIRPVHELDDLVDSLFAVEDKIANARQFIDRLDSRVIWMLDMLEQLDIPQLSEE